MENSVKLIHRYLPLELSLMVVQYLVLARPFTVQLHQLVLNEPAPGGELWSFRAWSVKHLSDF